MTEEEKRMEEARSGKASWRQWGPYLSERQWGTVREDYSPNGTAWEYFTHDHARSRAYRWGEDGIAGISDDKQQLCFALALWNGKDPILKERLFGLTNHEGNHGEDVKEYYFYLDNTPSHAYMKYLYKYPQEAYPYSDLVTTNHLRNRSEPEYELLDTGIFDEDRYYDVFIEYAKTTPEDILIQITIVNRGDEAAILHLLPTLWFRNTWSWSPNSKKPLLTLDKDKLIKTSHPELGDQWLYCDAPDSILFTENESNKEKLFNTKNDSPYVKDGIDEYVVHLRHEAVNPENKGTKSAVYYKLILAAGETKVVKLRLSRAENLSEPFGKEFDETFIQRKKEADAFYERITPYPMPEDMRNVQRQAFAGLLWNKPCYHYSVKKWTEGDPSQPKPPEARLQGRNHRWPYFDACDVFSMPDKWEFPWFASWDLAFHTISLAMIDPDFAKDQLLLLTREWYMAPDGQVPAYEWGFSDVNPPIHAWAAMRIYQIESATYGRKDRLFLEKMFQKLVVNFTWWVNRKDKNGRNVFEGGFLGLDNIGAFDSRPGPHGGLGLEQPDATGWMGMYCLNLLQIALELAIENPAYEEMASKFFEHFVYIADAINNESAAASGLWDEKEGFYYEDFRTPKGKVLRMREDSMTGIIPLFVVATNNSSVAEDFPNYRKRFDWFIKSHPEMLKGIADLDKLGMNGRILLAFATKDKLSRILGKVLDESQFLSPYGIRSVSKRLLKDPFILNYAGREYKLFYEPAETTSDIFGGNSNWRGPVWFPLNFLLIESLQKFHYYYGDSLKVECPVGSGKMANLWDVASDLTHRLITIFLKDENGKRPLYGGIKKFQNDPHWKDYIQFHEYFNGDNGAGLGANHQTGWTGLVAKLIHQYAEYKLMGVSPDKNKNIWTI